MSLIQELKRRNVLRVAAAYVVTAWLLIQVVETILPFYGVPDDVIRYVITALAVGFVPAVLLAWAFDWTPQGPRRDTGAEPPGAASPRGSRAFDRGIMVVLALGLGYFAFDKFLLSPAREADIAEAARQAGRDEAVIETYGDRSIAVLAFEDMSPERDQAYMSDGIAEEILNLLARVPELRVISRSSAFSFKGKNVPIPEIAATLNAAFVLEGSVRKAGDQIRITAQLIEAGSDTHRWSQTYDRRLENVFDIQDDIAAHVVEQLTSTLLADLPRSRRLDETAYMLVLQARYLWNRRAEGDEEEALELYQQAVAIEPDYAPAWTGLSVATIVAARKGRMDADEGIRLSREAIERALELDPDAAEARVRMGQELARNADWAGSLREYERAFQSEPNNPLVLGVMAQQARREGRIDEVVRLFERAAAVDPLGAIWPINKAGALIQFGRLDEAEQALKAGFAINGNQALFREGMVDILILRREFEAAVELLETMPEQNINLTRAVIVHHHLGHRQRAAELLAKIEADPNPFATLGIAMFHAFNGDNDRAFEWLGKVTADVPPWSIVYDGYVRHLTDDPRWRPYVDSLDWPWEYQY